MFSNNNTINNYNWPKANLRLYTVDMFMIKRLRQVGTQNGTVLHSLYLSTVHNPHHRKAKTE